MSKLKSILALCILQFSINSIHAQEMSCSEKVEKLLIDKVKTYNSKDLIPYYSEKDNNWGFFDRNTREIVTEPVMRRNAVFFKPNLRFYYSFETNGLENGCTGEIAGSNKNYKILSLDKAEYQSYDAYGGNYKKKTYENYVKNSISGFEVDEKGKLTYFNSRFYDEKEGTPLITQVIFFKDEFYAITKVVENDKDYYTIIKQSGEELSVFKKTESYPMLKQIFSEDDDLWFLTKTAEGKYVYKSVFKNETVKDAFDDNSIYGENQTERLGYVICRVNKKSGVFDLTTMKWKVKPTNKIRFSYLEYATSEELIKNKYLNIIENKDIEANRENSYIYIQTPNNEFYDLDLKLYKSKK